jgi:flagellar hook-associated protein 1 FlgK
VVLQRASAAAETLNQFADRLVDIRQQTTLRLDNTLGEVDGLARRVAELNGRIVRAEVGRQAEASDLRDQRDLAVDRLAQLVGATEIPRPDGSVQVTVAGYTLVDGIHPRALTRTTDALGRTALALADTPGRALKPIGGSAQAMVDFLNRDLQGAQDQLDATANALARAANAVHGAARDPGGAAGRPLFVDRTATPPGFDPSASAFGVVPAPGAVTARSIGVNADLEADVGLVLTSSNAAQPTGNDVALAIASLRTASTIPVGTGAGATTVRVTFVLPDRRQAPGAPDLPATAPATLADFYRASTGALAVQVQDAKAESEVHAVLADQARARRQSVSGVNVDEELTNLMRAQQAYAAAAKVVTAADEMMQALLQIV